MIKQYKKKPVVIEAMRYMGDIESDEELTEFMGEFEYDYAARPVIKTLEGDMVVSPGDYVIKGVRGEFYPCKPDIFAATYEVISNA